MTVTLVKKVWYLRGIYCSFAVRKKLNNVATIKYSNNANKPVKIKVLHKLLVLSINISRLFGVISYVRFLLPKFLSDYYGVFIDPKKAFDTPLTTMFC